MGVPLQAEYPAFTNVAGWNVALCIATNLTVDVTLWVNRVVSAMSAICPF